MQNQILVATEITKKFVEGQYTVEVLRKIDFSLASGEMVAIIGPSGSGKSTLLHILGGLAQPTTGSIFIDGQGLQRLSEAARCELRNRVLGFIYQFHHLLPEFSALENVAMPLLIGGVPPKLAKQQARQMLHKVGLLNREAHRLGELSGGERQRVAIARALVTQPKCVFADEPTGNLDHKTALQIYELLTSLNQELGTAFVLVTHDLTLARRMHRVMLLSDGVLQDAK